ncbi:MAG: hypothetical protein ABIV51_03300, partial [Saprospiraceae bacterium]
MRCIKRAEIQSSQKQLYLQIAVLLNQVNKSMENVDLFQVLQGLLQQFVSQLPPIFGSISILLFGIIVATLFSRLLFTILQKLRLDKLAGRVNRL